MDDLRAELEHATGLHRQRADLAGLADLATQCPDHSLRTEVLPGHRASGHAPPPGKAMDREPSAMPYAEISGTERRAMTPGETCPPNAVRLAPTVHNCTFPALPAQVRQARKFVSGVLDGCPAADDAVLAVSEYATNSVLHSASAKAGGTFAVHVEIWMGAYVCIEVTDDGGPWQDHANHDGQPHGLAIVAALAADTGRDGDPSSGWVVWARLDWPTHD